MTLHQTPSTPPTWYIPILLAAALSMFGAMYLGKVNATAEMVSRVSVLETKQTDSNQRLDRIEAKLDKVIYGLFGKQ